MSRCTQIADLTRIGQFPTLKSQTKPIQVGLKSRTICAAPPAALFTMALLGTFPCAPLPLCQQADQGLPFWSEPPVGLGNGLLESPLLHSNQGQTSCRFCPRFKYNCTRLKGNNIGLKSRQVLETTKATVRDFSTARHLRVRPSGQYPSHVMSSSHPLIDLFRRPEVNYLSGFGSFAARVRTAELLAWYSVELANAPKRWSRDRKYLVDSHNGRPGSGAKSNRLEEHLAMALFNHFRGDRMSLPGGTEMAVVDYQVPLKAFASDQGIGKIDVFGTVDVSSGCSGRVCELKVGRRDTPLKAIFECLAYHAIAMANLQDLSAELHTNLTGLECIVLAPDEYWKAFMSNAAAQDWLPEIRSLLNRIESDLGVRFQLLRLEDCHWSYGLDGNAPALLRTPRVHDVVTDGGYVPGNGFKIGEKTRQGEFRATSSSLSEAARLPIDELGRRVPYLLAVGYEEESLIPQLRGAGGAIDFFRQRGIHWWKSKESGDDLDRSGPTRNLLSSQVACVNVLMSLASDSEALLLMLRSLDREVTEVVAVDSRAGSALVEFEWCGLKYSLEGTRPSRGQFVTNADVFMIGRVGRDLRAYLWEWKYAECYKPNVSLAGGSSGAKRLRRYTSLFEQSASFKREEIPITELLYDPFYQLMRLRLLADRMTSIRELGVSSAKLIVVCPEGNSAYLETITSPGLRSRFPECRTVTDVFSKTLRETCDFRLTSPHQLISAVRDNCSPQLKLRLECLHERYGW